MAAAEDQERVDTLRSDGADETLSVGIRLRRSNRRVDYPDSFAAEHFVERSGELAVAIVDQEAHPFEHAGEAEVARLLEDPGSGRVRRATGEVDAPAAEFDEEKHVEATERDCLDGEEVAREHARGLLTKERRPTHLCAPRRRLDPSTREQTPDRAR